MLFFGHALRARERSRSVNYTRIVAQQVGQKPSKVIFPVWKLVSLCLNEFMDDEPIQLPIDGVLDLHTFQPREVKSLVVEYLAECRARGILRVRIIHGKGIGQLRQTVHTLLEKHPDVTSFNLASEHFGGWGATIVHLQQPPPNP